MIFTLELFYYVVGALLAAVAIMSLTDRSNPRRYTSALFWALYAVIYVAGDALLPEVAGAMMVAMALLAGCGGVRAGKPDVLPDGADTVPAPHGWGTSCSCRRWPFRSSRCSAPRC
jgi:uncharacterized membrane protein